MAVVLAGEAQAIFIVGHELIHRRSLWERRLGEFLLGEATNWLDNENQSKVMANLASLTSTRIVIAHRLSTPRQADRIYVMRAGKVAESGSFTDLMQTDGVFRDLVRRQIA